MWGDDRKEVLKNSEEEMYEFLYHYYLDQDNCNRSLSEAFLLLEEHKKDCLGRSSNTIMEDTRYFGFLSAALKNKPVSEVTDEDLQKWLISEFLPLRPKQAALKKTLQLLNQVFQYGLRKKLCVDNPMQYISTVNYLKRCDISRKSNEERAFSSEELEAITRDALKDVGNPRSLIALVAKETGLRAGELAALHQDDIKDGFIHVHRQQIRNKDDDNHEFFFEVSYTKDERVHPHDGRYVPITPDCATALEYADRIAGDSIYVFHDPDNPGMVAKDSYERNLRNRCHRLGIKASNNHAFRIAFNSRLIEKGFSASDRALILGHEVQTNENHYSLSDARRLESIKNRLV